MKMLYFLHIPVKLNLRQATAWSLNPTPFAAQIDHHHYTAFVTPVSQHMLKHLCSSECGSVVRGTCVLDESMWEKPNDDLHSQEKNQKRTVYG